MTWGVSTAAYYALRRSGSVRVHARAITAAQGILDLPVTGGSVTFDSKSNVRRQGTITVPNDEQYWPDNPFAVLSPWGTRIQVWYGIDLPRDQTEWVPLMVGSITKTPWTVGANDEISVTISDYCANLADDRFDVDTSTTSDKTVIETIQGYIWETIPDAQILDLTGNTKTCPVVDMQKDRLAGIVKLAESISSEVYCDRLGNFVIAPQATVDDPFTFTLEGSGLLLKANSEATRERVYNRVRVSGQTNNVTTEAGETEQIPPPYASAQDDDPDSPTRYGGPFGKKTRFYVSSMITTTEQAQNAARSILEKAKGTAKTVSYEAITDPTLDAGDVGLIKVRGKLEKHVIDSVSIPFSVGSTQSISTRNPVLPDEQDPEQGGTTPQPDSPAEDATVVQVPYGSVSVAAWGRMVDLGFAGRPGDVVESLYVPRNILEKVKAEYP